VPDSTNTVTLTGPYADRDAWSAGGCSIGATLAVIGRGATLRLLREAFYGVHRFEEFVRFGGFTEATTATRLKELVGAGILERRPYQQPGKRRRDEYHLTEKGAALFPVFLSLAQWGDKWAADGDGPVAFTHADCDQELSTEIRCAAGHQVALARIEAHARHPRARDERATAAR
jgi:DNA-binding HxlR family transcriptional regulator